MSAKHQPHVTQAVPFSDGLETVVVYASAGNLRMRQNHPIFKDIGFGLYADPIWHPPPNRNEFIDWADMRTPTFPEMARQQIIDAFIRACKGETVEVGCIGGHGRTGTILACMAVLAGETDPIQFIRNIYCERAVETSSQEVFVDWFKNRCVG